MDFIFRPISHWIDRKIVGMEEKKEGRKVITGDDKELPEFNKPEFFENPEMFFDKGTETPDVTVKPVMTRFGIKISHFSYKSPIESGYPENDTACGRTFEVREKVHGDAAPCAIVVHGWREAGAFEFYHYLLGMVLARYGVNSFFINQPYHGVRKPAGTQDGDMMLCADMEQTIRAFRQSVCDTRALISWVTKNYKGDTGIIGLSLGGFISSLVSCVDDRIKFLITVISGGDLETGMENSIVGTTLTKQLESTGITEEKARANWKVICPISYKSKLPVKAIKIIAGKFDLLIPPENTMNFWEKWKKPAIKWMSSGHISIGLFPRVLVSNILSVALNPEARAD
ncbi:MAG TPA: alpha/beta hydrolase family protein [bacterium]|nr:alpha/beta hydrolase family protein [bacterium]